MSDLVIRGGRVVSSQSIEARDVAITGGRVEALIPPGAPADARSAIDATGCLLIPGLVDAHVHLREPGLTHKEDFSTGTRAAIAGGVTTVLVMPTDDPWTETAGQLREKIALAEGRIHCDIGFQIALGRELRDIGELVAAGAVSFEVFTSDVPEAFRHDDTARLERALGAIASAGGLAAVSPGDEAILADRLAALPAGPRGPADFARSRPPIAEATGIARAVAVAADTGARVHIRQTSTALGIDTFRRLRSMADVTIETSPQLLLFTEADYARFGPLIKGSPPLRPACDVAALRAALADGTIDMVITDHAPHTLAEKAAYPDDFPNVPGGMPGLQTLLPAMLSLVASGVIDLKRLAAVCAENPARRFGLGGRKGRIARGYDADIVILDPAGTMSVRNADQHSKAGATPFDGLAVPWRIERVLLTGRKIGERPLGRCVKSAPPLAPIPDGQLVI